MSKIAKADDPSVRIRFPRKILRELDQAAARAGRSRNTEIIHRLTESFSPQQPDQSASQPG